jgi:hypothetical protein
MTAKLKTLLAVGLLWAPLPAYAAPVAPPPDPSPLASLWSISLGGDFTNEGSQDLQSFYAPGSIGLPATRVVPGYYLQGRKYISDSFFALACLSSLPKSYSVNQAGSQDQYEWDALILGTGGGWILYRALNFAFSAQAEAGWLVMSEGSFERSGANATKGTLEGSALATQFSVGGLWFVLPSVALDLCGGYRFARVPLSFATDAGNLSPTFAPQFYADFSGAYGRAGLSFFWGLRNPWGQSAAPPPPREGPPSSE